MKSLVYLVIVFTILSCTTDESSLIDSPISFSYIKTESFTDYHGDSSLLIFNNSRVINKSSSSIQHETYGAEIIYKDATKINVFNAERLQTIMLHNFSDDLIHSFSVSPNQKFLAYSNYDDILVINLDTGVEENLTSGLDGDFRFPKWSPESNSLLMRNTISKTRTGDNAPTATANFKIYSTINKSIQQVKMFDVFASPGQAKWSPNSDMIVYEQYQSVFIFKLNSNELSRITSSDIVATNPTFSNDGKMISFFSSDQSQNGNNWQSYLSVYDIASKNIQIINDEYSFDATWKSDSSKIVYATNNGIYLYELDTDSNKNLITPEQSQYLHNPLFLN